MRPADNINDLIKKLQLRASADLDARVHGDISEALAGHEKPQSVRSEPNIWRTIMKNPITKLAAAAVILIAVAISVTILDKSVTPAYAIEQTIEANRGLWFIHLKIEPSTKGHVDEMWVQFDDNRQLTHLRMNFPDKEVVWYEGRAEVWFKAKKHIAVLREKDMLARLRMSYESFDPKRIVEELYQTQGSENVQIVIQEPSVEGEPITITMTKKGSPNVRAVFEVDPETKLLQQEERYKLEDGEYKFLGRTRYLDYNNPADSEIFVLKPPADLIRRDQTTQDIGLAQGALSDEETAAKLVRQFVEAAIAQDYTKASKLIANVPAGWVEEQPYQGEQVVRLISLGKPELNAKTGSLSVPCQVEVEKDGQTSVQSIVFRVQQVQGRSGPWKIIDF
ncbi:hypothetical protein ACFL3Q_04910 [Planctomycetota bacterium]